MADPSEARAEKIEEFRRSLHEHPALLEQFNDIHPVKRPTTTLQQALTETAQPAQEARQPPGGGWYGWRHLLRLTCAEEFRLEKNFHRFM